MKNGIVWRFNLVPKTQNAQKSNKMNLYLKVKTKAEKRKNAKKLATKKKKNKYCPNSCNKPIKIIYVNAIE